MADRYWVGGTGNWSDNTNHWSASTGGAPNASLPTSADNVYFDANSFTAVGQTVTVDAAAYCLDMDWTGATNSPTLAGSSTLNISGSLTTIAAMTWSKTGTTAMVATSGAKTVTTNGLTIGATSGVFQINGAGGTFQLSDALTFGGTYNLTYTAGTFDPNGQTVTLAGTAHTLSGAWTFFNLTRTGTAANTNTVTFTSGTPVTVTGTFTLTGNSRANQFLAQSSTLGTAATINAATAVITNCDLMDITGAGAAGWDFSAQTDVGDCGGNTDITFPAGDAQTSSGTQNWSNPAGWTGTVGDRVPLPQDDVTCSHSKTVDMYRIGKSITFTGTPTISLSQAVNVYGSWTMVSGMTYAHNSREIFWRGRGNHTITCDGKTIYRIRLRAPSGSYACSDTLLANLYLTEIVAGELDINDQNATLLSLEFNDPTNARGLKLGNGTITLTRTDGNLIYAAAANLTFDAEGSTIVLAGVGATARNFQGGGLTYNNVTVEGAGAYAMTITGDNTFNTFEVDASAAVKTIKFTDGSTQMVGDIKRDSGTNIITLTGTGVAGWNIVKLGPGDISLDYLNVSYSQAS